MLNLSEHLSPANQIMCLHSHLFNDRLIFKYLLSYFFGKYPKMYRQISRCGAFEAEHTKRYHNHFFNPYKVRRVPPSFLYGGPPGHDESSRVDKVFLYELEILYVENRSKCFVQKKTPIQRQAFEHGTLNEQLSYEFNCHERRKRKK